MQPQEGFEIVLFWFKERLKQETPLALLHSDLLDTHTHYMEPAATMARQALAAFG